VVVKSDPGIEIVEPDDNSNYEALSECITCRITESLRSQITFAEYMELALYHPQYGYYASSPTKIGPTGDFITSPHMGADFGELLATQFGQCWELLNRPDRFTLVEMGAGQGLLAKDILQWLHQHSPELVAHLDYIIIERAAALLAEQKLQLQTLIDQGIHISWPTLAELPPNSITGCFFSNELIDALPVHQVIVQAGKLSEIYVALPEDEQATQPFIERIDELSTPAIAHYFEQVGIDLTDRRYPDGYRTEVNLAALDWLTQVTARLRQGYVFTIDYGYTSDRYYSPMRSAGTLQCYYRHRYHSNPYIYVGQQDITAHVDFTALQKQGEQCGLKTVGFTKQALFLMSLGLSDRIASIAQSQITDLTSMNEILRRRDALQTLIDPTGMGGFGVLIQSKGVERNGTLDGLRGEQI